MIPVMNAADVRKKWSMIIDSALRVKPLYIGDVRRIGESIQCQG